MLLHGFVNNSTWISLICFMDLLKMIHGFFYVCNMDFSKLICQSSYMDLFKLLHGFVKHVLYFSSFAKRNQAEV